MGNLSYNSFDVEEHSPDSGQLFSLEAFRKDSHDNNGAKTTFSLSTEPHRFVTAAMEAFDAGVAVVNEVQSLERLVMPHLSKSQTSQLLNGVDAKEHWVVQAREHLEKRLTSACPALTDFVNLLRRHEDLLRLDPSTHVKRFVERRDQPPDDIKVQAMIESEMAAQAELMRVMPEVAHVGIFLVGCKDLRRHLAQKHESVIALLFDVLLQRLRNQMNATFDSFQIIASQLKKIPKNVEELIDMRRFTEGVPRQVAQLQEKITKDVRVFDRLEDLHYYVPLRI
jgi:hypothetical protein